MNKTIRKTTHCPDYGRIARAGIQRNKPRNTVPVTLPIHTLEKFHRYTLNPMVMAVRDVDINQHDLVKVDGEFESLGDCQRNGFNKQTVSANCLGKHPETWRPYGYRFRFKTI